MVIRGFCVRQTVHQVQGQITRGACDYSKDVIANRLHSAERITASRGLPFTDPIMMEGNGNLKQHDHHHLPKPWELTDQERDSSPTIAPPTRNGVLPACLHCMCRVLQVVCALLLSSAFKHSVPEEDQSFYNDVSMALHSWLLSLVGRKLTYNNGNLLGILLSHWPPKPPNIKWSNISQLSSTVSTFLPGCAQEAVCLILKTFSLTEGTRMATEQAFGYHVLWTETSPRYIWRNFGYGRSVSKNACHCLKIPSPLC